MNQDILEFIERCMNDPNIQKQVENGYQKSYEKRLKSISRWNEENYDQLRKCQKKYESTPKGKYSCSKRNVKRQYYYQQACIDLTWEEKEQIGEFYRNCPEGYEVDHIQPISKGGKHKLSNLQYLTRKDNARKSNKWNSENE